MQSKLRADPAAIPGAIDDLLRLYAFVNAERRAVEDTTLDGVTIRAGDAVCCVLAGCDNESAGSQAKARTMAWGLGPHACAGMHLARLELRVLFETWFSRVGSFALAPGSAAKMRGGGLLAIDSLPLVLQTSSRRGAREKSTGHGVAVKRAPVFPAQQKMLASIGCTVRLAKTWRFAHLRLN